MQHQHPLDRLAYRLRVPLIVLAVISCPVMLYSYAWGMKQIMAAAPAWVSVLVVVSHIMVWLGIGSLFDMRQEKAPSSEP